MDKFKSRKFVSALSMALLIGLNEAIGLGLGEETLTKMVGILGAWILGESIVDASAARGAKYAQTQADCPRHSRSGKLGDFLKESSEEEESRDS